MQEIGIDMIGHYRVLQLLARGGMAKVYLAQDIQTGKLVAMKLVHSSAVEYSERFRFETETLAKLSHKHILPVIDYGEYESWHYLITPYIPRGTLNQRLKKGPLSCEHAGELLDQLAQALQLAHGQRLVHRDIKASNVLMRNEHFIYLADFGLAKYIDKTGDFTRSGSILGTPEYMAPELTEEKATPLSDLYSLGILLYQMVTGNLPFTGNNAINVCIKHMCDSPPLPSLFNSNISEAVENVILRALEKDPQKRFQTVQEFSRTYRQALEADRHAQMMAVTQVRVPVLKATQVRVHKIQRSRRHRPKLGTSILGLALLAFIPAMSDFSAPPPGGSLLARAGHHWLAPHTTGARPASVASTSTGSSLSPANLQKDKRSGDASANDNGGHGQGNDNSNNHSYSNQNNTPRHNRGAEVPANGNEDDSGNNYSYTNQNNVISVNISTYDNGNGRSINHSYTNQNNVVSGHWNVNISTYHNKDDSGNYYSYGNGKVHDHKK